MKVAIITDTHFGARGDSVVFQNHFNKFYDELFWPYLEENEIGEILHLGDLVDRRKTININTLNNMRHKFLDQCALNGVNCRIVIGNHDCYFKNTNRINSVVELREGNDYIEALWDKPSEIEMGSTKILLIPWLCQENFKESMEIIKNSKAPIAMGHLEIQGFEMLKGITSDHGLETKVFSHFQNVYTGHFHHPSTQGNITYLGAPYEMTWSDYAGKRGFHVFDTETREMEFIPNPYNIFEIIEYDDTSISIEDINEMDVSVLHEKYIIVNVENNDNPATFDLFMDRLYDSGAADIKIVEDQIDFNMIDEETLVSEAEDTPTIISAYIAGLETSVDRGDLKHFMLDLHKEALTL